MSFFTKLLSSKIFANKLNDATTHSIVGVSTDENNIAMVNITGDASDNLTVASYRLVATNNRQEQLAALTNYVEEYDLVNCACNYVLPVDKYVIGIIPTPETTTNHNGENISLAVKDLVDYSVNEAVVDLFSLPFKRVDDNKEVSYAVVAHNTVINDAAALILEAGLKLKAIDIQELCLRNLARLQSASNQGALLLRLHALGGHVVFMQEDTIFMARRLDLPLKDVLLDSVKISQWQQQTEQQKVNVLLDTLTLDLQRSMDYCSSIFRQAAINCLILMPSEFEIYNINNILTKHLGVTTYALNLGDLLQFNIEITKTEQAKYLLAIGAALRNIKVTLNESANKSISN